MDERTAAHTDGKEHGTAVNVITSIDSFRGEYAWLSNFHVSPITYDDITYMTVEHAYQAQKSMSAAERLSFSKLRTASAAKLAGRRVPMTEARRKWWDDNKLDIMAELLQLKFELPVLRQLLIATGDIELVEGNTWHDRYWGVCRCGVRPSNAGDLTKEAWRKQCPGGGQNWLGRLIMAVRAGL